MRPPGYVRPALPFDSIDRILEAAGVDLSVWRGLRVLAGRPDQTPEAELATRPINRLRKPISEFHNSAANPL